MFKISYPIRKIGFGLFFTISLNNHLASQDVCRMTEKKDSSYIDSLKKEYATNKVFAPGFELPSMIALSYYPELKDTRIEFVSKSIKTSMACRPTWAFFLRKRKNRVYRIYINNNPKKIKGAMPSEVPYNAQVGLIGHELGHVADYSRSGVFKIIGMGIKYLFTSGKVHMEKRVDKITVEHHLGWQLYDFCDYILNRSNATDAYKNYKRKIYYKPEDILSLIQQR